MASILTQDRKTDLILGTINNILILREIDKMMDLFVYMYELLDENVVNNSGAKKLREEIYKLTTNDNDCLLIDLFYNTLSGDGGSLLLDPSTQDESIYDIRTYITSDKKMLYSKLKEMKIGILTTCGKIANMLVSSSGVDFNF